jgi:phospholipid/cholesterol/gamma-HCH transport system substrate-binding protein
MTTQPRGGLRQRPALVGLIGLVCTMLVVALAMNAGRLPWIGQGGRTVTAEFADAGGLQAGNRVQVAGVDVGQIDELHMGAGFIVVRFSVDSHVRLGSETRAAIKVSNLLGSKYVELTPVGSGQLGATIPVARTTSPYDLTTAFGDLTRTLEPIDTSSLERALASISTTLAGAGPDVRAALRGLSGMARTITARNDDLASLLKRSRTVTASLATSRHDIATLIRSAALLLDELDRRKAAIRGLIIHTRELAAQLHGLVRDNQASLRPALDALSAVTLQLRQRQRALRSTLHGVALFARVFVNTIGGGPWFDSYVGNAPNSLKREDPQ